MLELTVTALDLIPVQAAVDGNDVFSYANQIKSQGYYPVPVLKSEKGFMLGDGHHTCSALYLMCEPIDIVVLETDKEVRDYKKGVFCMQNSLKSAYKGFLEYVEEIEDLDIKRIGDLFFREKTDCKSVKRLRDVKYSVQSPDIGHPLFTDKSGKFH